ncbi:CLUMA_CG016021, isoform A [Clunio marinus]|uniref:CLUMA_CG016021, isoform A n=1 Tax=Clunio marinus TaxID=568069 RepID=A0A1J1IRN8_9DIPT|nr:CLUMA_CG016021, isoform A [Clunio marinus]
MPHSAIFSSFRKKLSLGLLLEDCKSEQLHITISLSLQTARRNNGIPFYDFHTRFNGVKKMEEEPREKLFPLPQLVFKWSEENWKILLCYVEKQRDGINFNSKCFNRNAGGSHFLDLFHQQHFSFPKINESFTSSIL